MTENKNSKIQATEAKKEEEHPLLTFLEPETQSSDQDSSANQDYSSYLPKKHFPVKILVIIAAIFLLILLVLGVVAFYRYQKSKEVILYGTEGELVWWGREHDAEVYQELISEFEREHPGVSIRYERKSETEYRERLSNALTSGKGPDIFEIHNSWPRMFVSELANLPPEVMTFDEFKSTFYPIFANDLTLNKNIVAIPLEYDAITLYINQDIFDVAIMLPPTTWAEVGDLAPALTQVKEKGIISQAGIAMGITTNVDYWPEIIGLLLYQNGVDLAKPQGARTVEAVNFYKAFKTKKVWNETLANSTSAFARGELAMYFGPSARAGEIKKENPDLNFKTVQLPQIPKGSPSDPNYSYATYWAQAVWSHSINKKTAWEFLKFLSERSSLQKINQEVKKREIVQKPYPIPDLNIALRDDPVLGSVILLANDAKSWYLADSTFDGEKGINFRMNSIYAEMVAKMVPKTNDRQLKVYVDQIKAALAAFPTTTTKK